MRRIFISVATLAQIASAQARDLPLAVNEATLQDYCDVMNLSPGRCQRGVNAGVAAECKAGYDAVALSCFLTPLIAPLASNSVVGRRGVCDWLANAALMPANTARATVLCRRTK